METFLLKIEKMFEKQNVFIEKQFNKLSKRITNLKSRVVALEKDKRTRDKPKPKPDVVPFNSFVEPVQEKLKADLENLEYTRANVITSQRKDRRANPKLFQHFVKSQFEDPRRCNIYQKGERTYVYQDGWVQVDAPGELLTECINNLWDAFNETCEEVLKTNEAHESVFRPIILENKRLGSPISTAKFKTIIRKVGKQH